MFEHGVPGVAALLVGELLERHVLMPAAIAESTLSFGLAAFELARGGVLTSEHVVVPRAHRLSVDATEAVLIPGVRLIRAGLAVA